MFAENPPVSVIMTVYNGANFLKSSIESILNQTFRNFEFLIINDGSTENITAIVSSYTDPRIRYINRSENRGRVSSLNEGLDLAKGEYIAIQDADDIALPTRLEKEAQLLDQNPEIGLTGTFFSIINEAGIIISDEKLPSTDQNIKKKLPHYNVFAHGSLMFRKEILVKSGYYREEFSADQCEDYDFLLRASEHTEVANIPEYLYQWRLHKSSFTSNRRYFQNIKANIARQMFRDRQAGKKDAIQNGSYKEILNSTNIPSPSEVNSSEVRSCIINGYHFQIMSFLYNAEKTKAFITWRKAILYNFFDLKSWFFLTLICIRLILPTSLFNRLIYAIYKIRNLLS